VCLQTCSSRIRKLAWLLLESTCCFDEKVSIGLESQAEEQKRQMPPHASVKATQFMTELRRHSMTPDDSPTLKTPVTPCSLAWKMNQRGIEPLLVSLAYSPVEPVLVEAMSVLSQISHVKDCCTIMLQGPGGLE